MENLTQLRVRELTAKGPGGVRVIRIEGPGALQRCAGLWPALKNCAKRPVLVRLIGDESHASGSLDEALAWSSEPDCLELGLHGSAAVVEAVCAHLVERGCQLAGAEQERHSSTLEQRAQVLLAQSQSEVAARIFLDQAQGALRRELQAWSACDDSELLQCASRLLKKSERVRLTLRPIRVVLAGPTNAGKSTLFNLLVGSERAVVSDMAGTTRDRVVERGRLGSWVVDWMDTAGLRDLPELERGAEQAQVEQVGQRMGLEAWSWADLVLWVEPAFEQGAAGGVPAIPAQLSKAELRWVRLQTAAIEQPDQTLETVQTALREALGLPGPGEVLWQAGQAILFESAQRRALLGTLRDAEPTADEPRRQSLRELASEWLGTQS